MLTWRPLRHIRDNSRFPAYLINKNIPRLDNDPRPTYCSCCCCSCCCCSCCCCCSSCCCCCCCCCCCWCCCGCGCCCCCCCWCCCCCLLLLLLLLLLYKCILTCVLSHFHCFSSSPPLFFSFF